MEFFSIEKLEGVLAPANAWLPIGYPWIGKIVKWILGY